MGSAGEALLRNPSWMCNPRITTITQCAVELNWHEVRLRLTCVLILTVSSRICLIWLDKSQQQGWNWNHTGECGGGHDCSNCLQDKNFGNLPVPNLNWRKQWFRTSAAEENIKILLFFVCLFRFVLPQCCRSQAFGLLLHVAAVTCFDMSAYFLLHTHCYLRQGSAAGLAGHRFVCGVLLSSGPMVFCSQTSLLSTWATCSDSRPCFTTWGWGRALTWPTTSSCTMTLTLTLLSHWRYAHVLILSHLLL